MAFLSSKLGNGPLLDHGPKEEILRYNIALWKNLKGLKYSVNTSFSLYQKLNLNQLPVLLRTIGG